ncbi:MAG: hypothetical protein FJX65_08955 [Alphaproteobacteria bacterium]|nr:hypothetical protein [Alphaproteobacteria bacterium]
MAQLMKAERVRAERAPLMVAGYTKAARPEDSYFITRYLGALPATVNPVAAADRVRPQAYLVEQPPRAEVPAHYHDTNQFQVFLHGEALFGRKLVDALSIHYASGHTPYGPLVTRERPAHYLTLRNRWDSGGKTMPQSRATLRPIKRRFRMAEALGDPRVIPEGDGVRWHEVIPCENDGLGAALFALSSGSPCGFDLPQAGAGRYVLVLAGTLVAGEDRLGPDSCVHLAAGETAEFVAAESGASVLVMQFPPEPA